MTPRGEALTIERISDIRDEAVFALVGAAMRLASPRAQRFFRDVIRAGTRAEKERLLLGAVEATR